LGAVAGSADRQVGAGRGQFEAMSDHLRLDRVAGTAAAEAFIEAFEAPDIVRVDAGAGKVAGEPEILAVGLLSLLDPGTTTKSSGKCPSIHWWRI